VGTYLSPGLFVSYGVGLFEPGTVITLRYEISERWSLEATDSPDDQRGGIHFRIER
jgi:translocation and assembly module TamB